MHKRKTSSSAPKSSNGHFSNNMYRNGNSRGYDPERGGLSSADMNANIMEQQNNDRIDDLSEQVARLKGLTIDIGNEVREQNSLLDQMGEGFSHTGDLLSGSLKKIGTMLDSAGAKHMCYMVAFTVATFVVLYMLMKST